MSKTKLVNFKSKFVIYINYEFISLKERSKTSVSSRQSPVGATF